MQPGCIQCSAATVSAQTLCAVCFDTVCGANRRASCVSMSCRDFKSTRQLLFLPVSSYLCPSCPQHVSGERLEQFPLLLQLTTVILSPGSLTRNETFLLAPLELLYAQLPFWLRVMKMWVICRLHIIKCNTMPCRLLVIIKRRQSWQSLVHSIY